MSRDQHDPLRVLRICSLQDRINIGDSGGLRNPVLGRFHEAVRLYFQAAAAVFRILFKFRLDPLARRPNAAALPNGSRILCREREPRAEADQLLDVRLDLLRGHLPQSSCDLGIVRHARRVLTHANLRHSQKRYSDRGQRLRRPRCEFRLHSGYPIGKIR